MVWALTDNRMNKQKRILEVPKDSSLRNRLRNEVRHLVAESNLLPPASFEEMEQLAASLLNRLEISAEFTDFTIVLIGNETWRKIVEATPFNRRLLLLPQCLSNKEKCKGVFDQLGLNCAGCKACPIDDILIEAENLGYATLVAEGTTVAIGLVEEGAIDAVIGVSCMPVLQRSFEPVSNAAVPVIGVPLLFDGCKNTQIDIDWLYSEVRAYNENKAFHPISTSGLKAKIDHFFTDKEMANYILASDETAKLAIEYMQIGGQRMRPLIGALSYLAYSVSGSDEILYPLSLIIECFHKASLIHDDIEDDADLRYNYKTAHKKYGIPQAINTGDFLIGKGYSLLSSLPVKSELMVKCLKQISHSHIKLTQGQGADILFNSGQNKLGMEETIQIFKNKTGEAIKVALLLGAVLGEADDSELQILNDFSDLFGISYQIRDDLNEFSEKNESEKTADFPFLVAMLNGQFTEETFANVAEFRTKVVQNNLHIKAEEILNAYVQKCYAELNKLQNAKMRLSLYGILGKIFKPIAANE